jgi:two-component system LytT family response regulator
MDMIRAIIIDDDAFIRKELAEMLAVFKEKVELIGSFENPIESIDPIKRLKPDLIFLDIQMPLMNGFELLDVLDTSSFEVTFITSYDKYAIQAIRYSALDYLLKPISFEDLKRSIALFDERNEKVLTKARLSILKHNLNTSNTSSFELIIPTKQGEYQFPVNDIIRCEADSNYTMIYLRGGKKFLASKTLSNIENLIESEQFLRVHKSHLVNKECIRNINASNEIEMNDNSMISISRRRLTEVKSLLGVG